MFFIFTFHINDRWTSLCKSKAEESYWKWELTSWWQFSWEKNESKARKDIFSEKPCITLSENSLSLVSEAFVYLPYRVILKYRIVIVIVEVNIKVLPFEYWPVTPSCFRQQSLKDIFDLMIISFVRGFKVMLREFDHNQNCWIFGQNRTHLYSGQSRSSSSIEGVWKCVPEIWGHNL